MRPSTYMPGFEPEQWGEEPALRVLSLGAGIQSTAIALMAERGMFGVKLDAAIFADTHAEPRHVYDNIKWIADKVEYPVYVVDAGDSLLRLVKEGRKKSGVVSVTIPAFVRKPDGTQAIIRRQCTLDFKVRPVRRKITELLQEKIGSSRKPRHCVEQWLGISMDERSRMRDSYVQYIYNYYPLIEGIAFSRADCAAWLDSEYPGHIVHKSACTFCPFHDDQTWAEMKRDRPADFQEAVLIDERLRSPDYPAQPKDKEYLRYLHSSLRPLAEVDFDGADLLNKWNNECEGHCGV